MNYLRKALRRIAKGLDKYALFDMDDVGDYLLLYGASGRNHAKLKKDYERAIKRCGSTSGWCMFKRREAAALLRELKK